MMDEAELVEKLPRIDYDVVKIWFMCITKVLQRKMFLGDVVVGGTILDPVISIVES
jgi:hypothetical protein